MDEAQTANKQLKIRQSALPALTAAVFSKDDKCVGNVMGKKVYVPYVLVDMPLVR